MKRDFHEIIPGQPLIVADNDEARMMIADLGLLNFLEEAKLRLPSEPLVVITSENHKTHWIAAGFYRGFENPDDNGFYLACYPKTHLTFQQFEAHLQSSIGCSYTEHKRLPNKPS